MQLDPTFVPERSIWVILRDYEQESEIVLMLWALAIIGQKALALRREQALFERDLVTLGEGMRILPEDVRGHARTLQALPEPERSSLLPRALLAALHRFGATGSIADASASAHGVCEGEADRLDSELSLLRYVAWAIPAIGFIGTVRGIGDALAQAHRAMQGDLSGVTAGLGTAFNSTLIALLLSLRPHVPAPPPAERAGAPGARRRVVPRRAPAPEPARGLMAVVALEVNDAGPPGPLGGAAAAIRREPGDRALRGRRPPDRTAAARAGRSSGRGRSATRTGIASTPSPWAGPIRPRVSHADLAFAHLRALRRRISRGATPPKSSWPCRASGPPRPSACC